MADIIKPNSDSGLRELWKDNGGVYSRVGAMATVNADGSAQNALPAGRATAANSVPIALSTEDYARISQTYRRAGTVASGAGDAVFVTGVTTAGTVTISLVNGGTVTVSVPIGSTILAFSASAAALGTAVGGTFQNLFFT